MRDIQPTLCKIRGRLGVKILNDVRIAFAYVECPTADSCTAAKQHPAPINLALFLWRVLYQCCAAGHGTFIKNLV